MKEETVSVIVVGTGCAGCAAALGAVTALREHDNAGAEKVLLLEKSRSLVGGTTKLAGGGWLWAPNNKYLTDDFGVRQDPEEIVELLMSLAYPNNEGDDKNFDEGDLDLMKGFAEEWPGVVNELMERGYMKLRQVETREAEDSARVRELLLKKIKEHPRKMAKVGISVEKNVDRLAGLMPSYCADHALDFCPSGKVLAPDGSTTSRQLEKAVRRFEQQTEIRMNARVVSIVKNPDGSVGGVVVETRPEKNGEKKRHTIRAKRGVIFASGGYSHNADLMSEAFGKGMVKGTCATRANVGDFVTICRSNGIPVSNLDRAWVKQVVLPFKPERIGVFFLNADSFIVVDRSGNRFANEKNFYQERGMQMINEPEQRRCVFFIFDERSRELYEGPIKGLGGPIPLKDREEDCLVRGSNAQELTASIRSKLAQVAPEFTLDEGFGASLSSSIRRFNHCASTNGVDDLFGRGDVVSEYCWHVPRAKDNPFPNKTMFPLDEAKLCCVILGLSTLDTKGGCRIDRHGRVLRKDRTALPRLYAAGNCCRSSTNFSYPASGATMANAVHFGYVAGKHAAGMPIQKDKQRAARL